MSTKILLPGKYYGNKRFETAMIQASKASRRCSTRCLFYQNLILSPMFTSDPR